MTESEIKKEFEYGCGADVSFVKSEWIADGVLHIHCESGGRIFIICGESSAHRNSPMKMALTAKDYAYKHSPEYQELVLKMKKRYAELGL